MKLTIFTKVVIAGFIGLLVLVALTVVNGVRTELKADSNSGLKQAFTKFYNKPLGSP